MIESLRESDLDSLRAFYQVAKDLRMAVETRGADGTGELKMVGGYIESEDVVENYRPLCIPVRRAYLRTDPAHLGRVCSILESLDEREAPGAEEACGSYAAVVEDLESHTILNEQRLKHTEVFEAWLDAVVFGEFGHKDEPYRQLLQEYGKPVEGIAVRLTEGLTKSMLEVGDAVGRLIS